MYLDDVLLNKDGTLRIVKAELLAKLPLEDLTQWCLINGVYQLPTEELIKALRLMIGGLSAIEICAGKDSIGRALGIPSTDSFAQSRYTEIPGAQRVHPPYYVERISAMAAIQKYRPRVVLGAFVPEVSDDGLSPGVNEYDIIKSCNYIHIGHVEIHRDKKINEVPHKVITPPYLVSRVPNRTGGIIQVWPRLLVSEHAGTTRTVVRK